jgi:hypothetical protein
VPNRAGFPKENTKFALVRNNATAFNEKPVVKRAEEAKLKDV